MRSLSVSLDVCQHCFDDSWYAFMLSRITGYGHTEKASQEQVSDKAAAGVTSLARLVQLTRKDSGSKVLAQASKDLNTTSDHIVHTQETLQQYSAALNALGASCTSALGVLQHSLPLQHAADEACKTLTKEPEHQKGASQQTCRSMEAVHTDSPILKTAQAQFQQKKYDLCLLTLHTLSQAGGADEANAQALAAMCKIHKHAALQEWHKVLGIPKDAEQADAKRQYRKLAALVHPDKCALEGAEEAFKLLGKSAACLTLQGHISSDEGTEATHEGPVAAWWEDWDDVDAPARKRKHPTSKPTVEDTQEDHGLASLSVQALQAEVRRRQAAVLRPEPGSEEESLNAFQRQKRLRVARTVLGEHLQQSNSTAGRGFC